MSLTLSDLEDVTLETLDLVEQFLEANGWHYEREDADCLHCIVPSRWGELGALFAVRQEPTALHFSVTLDVKPQARKRAALNEMILMVNERLWLGHFDYWAEEGVILFRHALPLLDRDVPSGGEVRAVMASAVEAVDRFVPAFNFVIWAGKSPEEAIEAALFDTQGEA